MNKKEYYLLELKKIKNWKPFLLKESGLPGKRANLELLLAVAELGDEKFFNELRKFDAQKAPQNSPYEFLAMCGVVGLGKLIAEGKKEYFKDLRKHASDARWRIREGVAFALQAIGAKDPKGLLAEMEKWKEGNLLEKRAVAAGLCDPRILDEKWFVTKVLRILDMITDSLRDIEARKTEEFRVLRKGLAYCWSVAAAAFPQEGKKFMEKWMPHKDKDIAWIMKENLEKKRLVKMDAEWVEQMKAILLV